MISKRVHVAGIGYLTLSATELGLRQISFDSQQDGPSAPLDASSGKAAGILATALAELNAYGAGRLREFTVPLDPTVLPAGIQTILAELRKVSYATTISYGALASAAGRPGAARLAGNAMARNSLPIIIPCHRVVAAGGIGGYTPGLNWKRRLWDIEGLAWPQGAPCQ